MRIVTMSRQVGSLGNEIATLTAKKMDLELIERTSLHELAQSCDPEYKDACEVYESEHGLGFGKENRDPDPKKAHVRRCTKCERCRGARRRDNSRAPHSGASAEGRRREAGKRVSRGDESYQQL